MSREMLGYEKRLMALDDSQWIIGFLDQSNSLWDVSTRGKTFYIFEKSKNSNFSKNCQRCENPCWESNPLCHGHMRCKILAAQMSWQHLINCERLQTNWSRTDPHLPLVEIYPYLDLILHIFSTTRRKLKKTALFSLLIT